MLRPTCQFETDNIWYLFRQHDKLLRKMEKHVIISEDGGFKGWYITKKKLNVLQFTKGGKLTVLSRLPTASCMHAYDNLDDMGFKMRVWHPKVFLSVIKRVRNDADNNYGHYFIVICINHPISFWENGINNIFFIRRTFVVRGCLIRRGLSYDALWTDNQ